MKLKYVLFLVSLFLSGQSYAERLVLSDIMPPEGLKIFTLLSLLVILIQQTLLFL